MLASPEMNSALQGLSAGLAAAAAAIGTSYLLRSVRPLARQEGSTSVVEYGRTMKLFVIVAWLFGAGGAIAAALTSNGVPERVNLLVFCTVTGFLLMVLSLHLEFFHVSIRYDAAGLHMASPWRRNRFVPWSAITSAGFSPTLQWYVLSTSGLGYVRLHLYLSGLQSLLDELTTRGISIPAATLNRK